MGAHPDTRGWYFNLLANPGAEIQVRDQHLAVTAHTASDDEKPRLWTIMTDIWPNYDVYQGRTDRIIPVVVLTPTA